MGWLSVQMGALTGGLLFGFVSYFILSISRPWANGFVHGWCGLVGAKRSLILIQQMYLQII